MGAGDVRDVQRVRAGLTITYERVQLTGLDAAYACRRRSPVRREHDPSDHGAPDGWCDAVYEARNADTRERVAVKVLHADVEEDEIAVRICAETAFGCCRAEAMERRQSSLVIVLKTAPLFCAGEPATAEAGDESGEGVLHASSFISPERRSGASEMQPELDEKLPTTSGGADGSQ